jgi:hypothetical protein
MAKAGDIGRGKTVGVRPPQWRPHLSLSYPDHINRHKSLLALSAASIAFYLADQALYDGRHVMMVGRFVGAIGAGFGWVSA